MEIDDAINQIDQVTDEINDINVSELTQIDLAWLEKARAALEARRELGGKREYIANQIAAGMLAGNAPFKCWEDCADAAVQCADALLKRLSLG